MLCTKSSETTPASGVAKGKRRRKKCKKSEGDEDSVMPASPVALKPSNKHHPALRLALLLSIKQERKCPLAKQIRFGMLALPTAIIVKVAQEQAQALETSSVCLTAKILAISGNLRHLHLSLLQPMTPLLSTGILASVSECSFAPSNAVNSSIRLWQRDSCAASCERTEVWQVYKAEKSCQYIPSDASSLI